ncbi:MAG: DUF11 domain-containing protein, partial [Anaerolineae bacterium]|nr:DUF11 domain-containing protein [Anaerolineae bacterium]
MLRNGRLFLLLICGLLMLTPGYIVSAAPLPNVTLDLPAEVFIGDRFEFSVTFQNNAASDMGFGPFIDLWLPRNGADGNNGTATPDGITLVSAAYLGFPVNTTVFTFPVVAGSSTGCIAHPYLHNADYGAVQICGTSGDQLVVIELPFGSFTPAQPAAEIIVEARISDLADLNVPLTIRARGGFRFGQTPLDDPCCDAPVTGTEVNGSVTPTLLTIAKENNAPESEIPAGPNFPFQWTITVGVPDGQTINDLTITDDLPPQITYIDVVAATPPLSTPPIVGGGEVSFNIASVTGVAGDEDVSITFEFTANNVLDPNSGEEQQIFNAMNAVGTWQPNDPRDAGTAGNATASGECNATTCPGGDAPYIISLAIQKTAAALVEPIQPGVGLEYTLDFQLADFYAFGDVILTDIISDGQHLDPAFTPRITYTQHGATQTVNLNPANYDVLEYWTGGNPGTPAVPPAVNGDTVLVVRFSTQTGEPMLGGCIPPAGTANPDCGAFNQGATTGSLIYRTIVLDEFVDNFPSGDASVDHGDLLNNAVVIDGQMLNPGDFTPGGFERVTDDSNDKVKITRGELTKAVFAVNGAACGACVNVEVANGDTVTYRLQQELPSSDFEDFRLVDYVPLPVYNAAEITNFSYTIDNVIPPAGTAKFYSGDTLYNLMQTVRPGSPQYPVIQIDATANSITFNYGAEFDDPLNRPSLIDLLFTVTVTDQPFADGLLLTNVLQSQEESTNAGDNTAETVTPVEVNAPLLLMTKGVVATSNSDGQFAPINPGPVSFNPPGSATPFNPPVTSTGLATAPINSNISNVQIGDVLTFAIVIENTGNNPAGAFDIRIRDTLSPGFGIPDAGLNLTAQLGNGVSVGFTPLGASGGDNDLFDQGIELIDPGVNGVCGPYSDDTGLNIVVITYDLEITSLTTSVLTNTASVTGYGSEEGGTDFTGDQDLSDTAEVQLVGGGGGGDTGLITKTVDKPFAQPGERVTWTIEVLNTSPATLNDVVIADTLPAELEPISAVTTRGTVTLSN